jgi:hypothetical protein
VRVAFQNLWGIRGDWPARREVLKTGLERLSPELVAFVEAIETDEYDQVADLLGPDYHLFHAATRHDNGDGASLASRWPLGEPHELDLHVTARTADFACTALVAEVRAPDPYRPLVFANHMPSWQLQFERERELQAVVTARFLEQFADGFDMHVVLVGDLTADPTWPACASSPAASHSSERASANGTPGRASTATSRVRRTRRRTRCSRTGIGPRHGSTTSSSAAGSTAARRSKVKSCERIFAEPVDGVWASDHFGVVADLKPPEPRVFV